MGRTIVMAAMALGLAVAQPSAAPVPVQHAPTAIPVDSKPVSAPTDAPTTIPVDNRPVSAPVIQPVGPGQVDWSYQTIRATGMSVIDPAKPKAQALALAIRGAKVDAQRNLLETVKGVRVVAETRVVDMVAKSDFVLTRLDGVVKGAVVVGEPRETSDGRVEVTMEIPVYDKGGIAAPLAEELMKTRPARVGRGPLSEAELVSAQNLSGVIFDLTGVNIDPQLFPTLVDSSGNVLLDMAEFYGKSGPEAFKRLKYVRNVSDMLNDAELRSNPAVVKIVKAIQQGWVVASQDVKKVSWLDKALDIVLKLGKAVLMFL
jgi:hypothetical protein